MRDIVAIFIGSGIGGVFRFGLSRWVDNDHERLFPFGTLVVNVIACLILGCLLGLLDQRQTFPPTAKLFLTVGFCGGFSTFSAFSNETLNLFKTGETMSALLYIIASAVLGLGATFAGLLLGGKI